MSKTFYRMWGVNRWRRPFFSGQHFILKEPRKPFLLVRDRSGVGENNS